MSAPEACTCRFCGESYTPAGIKNHERWCDDHPEKGMDPDRAEELGLLDQETAGAETPDADPHQRDNPGGLPSRSTLPAPDKNSHSLNTGASNGSQCPGCGSTDVISSAEALQQFRARLDRVPKGLEQTLEATDRYCNECYSVSGGALAEPFDLEKGVGT